MVRFNLKQLLLLCAIAGLGACVKDPQDIPAGGVIDNPVFQLNGQFDGHPVNIQAGNSMWTSVPLTTYVDSQVIYSSMFSIDGCTTQCSPSWTFNLYQALPAYPLPDESFLNTVQPGDLKHIPSDEERFTYNIHVETHPDLFYTGYSYWDDLNNPVDTFGAVFDASLSYGENLELCFHSITQPFGCQYNQCLTYDPRTGVPCTAFIQTQLHDNSHLSMTVRFEGTAPFRVKWMNGETSPSIVVPIYDSIGMTSAFADVLVTDANDNSIRINQTVIVRDGIVDACFYPINVYTTPVPDASPGALAGGLEIIHRDAAGNEWRSSAAPQPADANAMIHAMDFFGLSPYDEETYKVSMSVKLWLTNTATGESKLFEANELMLPFSHPR